MPQSASAAPPQAEVREATDGVGRVYHDYSGEGDASSIELNPALLSTIRGFDLTVLGYRAVSDFTRGTGFGGFAAFGFGFGLSLGFGAQLLQPGFRNVFDYAAARHPQMTKLSWALSAGLGEFGALGLSLAGVRADGRWLQRPDLDVGLVTRILNYGSLGLVARLSPLDGESQDLPSHASLTAELAIRPLGTHHLELAGGATSVLATAVPGGTLQAEGLAGVMPRGRVAVRWHGLEVRGEVEQVRTHILDPMSFQPLREDKAVRGGVSLAGSWDYATVSGGINAGVSDGIDGWGLSARFHSHSRGRVAPVRPVDVERLRLSEIDDARSLVTMLQRIEAAREGGKRTVLLVDARGVDAGWAGLHELREAFIRVRNAGGHVFAYVEDASLKEYYLASVAQKVFIHPAGSLDTFGIASTTLYFGETFDKLGVQAEVLSIGEYKSAGEQLTRTGPSEEDRQQREAYLADVYDRVVYDIAVARGLDLGTVEGFIDGAPHGPEDAVEAGFVDAVVHRDELEREMSEVVGTDVAFRQNFGTKPDDVTWSVAPYVGVVLVEDSIVDGPSRHIPILDITFTGGDTIASTIRRLRNDPFCRGIVLRVDSPGGSALASDVIWREVSLTAQEHRRDRKSPPIVVSMSDYAASGGYYVAVGADTIFADPLTLTGSIGVVAVHFDLSGLLAKLGISAATFKEGEHADITSLYKPYSDEERERLLRSMNRVYQTFIGRVAAGRKLETKRVDELGRGHVYSGLDAQALGLVDHLGGLHEAVEHVRKAAGVRAYQELELKVLPRQPRLLDLILESLGWPLRGPAERVMAQRERKRRASRLQDALPPALDRALSRLPLSLLYFETSQPEVILPWRLEE